MFALETSVSGLSCTEMFKPTTKYVHAWDQWLNIEMRNNKSFPVYLLDCSDCKICFSGLIQITITCSPADKRKAGLHCMEMIDDCGRRAELARRASPHPPPPSPPCNSQRQGKVWINSFRKLFFFSACASGSLYIVDFILYYLCRSVIASRKSSLLVLRGDYTTVLPPLPYKVLHCLPLW